MRAISLNLFKLLFFINLPIVCLCQAPKQMPLSWNAKQTSAFIENKGQVTDQDGKPRPDVKYIYNAPGFKLILKENSFSYEFYTVQRKSILKPDDRFSALELMPEPATVKSSRVDITFAGANTSPVIIAEDRSTDFNNYYLAHTPEAGVTDVYSYSKITYRNIYNHISTLFFM